MQHRFSGLLACCLAAAFLSACPEASKRRGGTTGGDEADAEIVDPMPVKPVARDGGGGAALVDAGSQSVPPDAAATNRDTGTSLTPDALGTRLDTMTAERDSAPPDTAPAVSAEFTMLADMLTSCVGCHSGEEANHINLRSDDAGGFLPGLYQRLVNAKPPATSALMCRTQTLVVPKMPTSSLLYNKIMGTNLGGCGNRMPASCVNGGNCWTAAKTKILFDWITAGAKL